MKKIVFLLLSGLIFSTSIFSQTDKQNIVKVYPASFVFGKGTIGYERVLDNKQSLTLNLSLPTGINPLKIVPFEENDEMNLIKGKLSAFSIMPGYRFNFSEKGAPLGFYIEPYLKYEKFNIFMDSEFIDDEQDRFLSTIDAGFGAFGAGVQMGIQFLINDVVSVEWSILGLEAKVAKIDLLYTDLDGDVNMEDVRNELEVDYTDYPFIKDKFSYEIRANEIHGKTKGFLFPGVRSAVSIGIAF